MHCTYISHARQLACLMCYIYIYVPRLLGCAFYSGKPALLGIPMQKALRFLYKRRFLKGAEHNTYLITFCSRLYHILPSQYNTMYFVMALDTLLHFFQELD